MENKKYDVFLSRVSVDKEKLLSHFTTGLNSQGKKFVLPLFIGERKKLIENYPLIEGIKGLYLDDRIDYLVYNLKNLL